MKKNKLLIITGTTATGKTSYALGIANKIPAELVSCDSRQVYRHMDIVTGKDIPEGYEFHVSDIRYDDTDIGYYEGLDTRIWGYDFVLPDQDFSVKVYLECVSRIIPDIWSRGRLPIVVGGTGMYIQSLLNPPETLGVARDEAFRRSLSGKSPDELYALLQKQNRTKAARLNSSERTNPHRLIRALEIERGVHSSTVSPKLNSFQKELKSFDSMLTGLVVPDRAVLYDRINRRVDERVGKKLEKEMNFLASHNFFDHAPSRTIGYKEWNSYQKGAVSRDQAIWNWKHKEHAYARRQLTWFRSMKSISWTDCTDAVSLSRMTEKILKWYTDSV